MDNAEAQNVSDADRQPLLRIPRRLSHFGSRAVSWLRISCATDTAIAATATFVSNYNFTPINVAWSMPRKDDINIGEFITEPDTDLEVEALVRKGCEETVAVCLLIGKTIRSSFLSHCNYLVY